jgi:uncharacterized NAD(P)/FAD-binding protein YdhS
MQAHYTKKNIAILGGGPSGLFLFKRLIESGDTSITISIFERKQQLGAGMPYSAEGANVEHITNVSDNEIPTIVTSIAEWVNTAPQALLDKFGITPENFNEYKVLPRLFFGEYLTAQFKLLQLKAAEMGFKVNIQLGAQVVDLKDEPDTQTVKVRLASGAVLSLIMWWCAPDTIGRANMKVRCQVILILLIHHRN